MSDFGVVVIAELSAPAGALYQPLGFLGESGIAETHRPRRLTYRPDWAGANRDVLAVDFGF
jgi:hypothetical protein